MNWIQSCLKSLKSSEKEIGIVVADNGSSDGTAEWISLNYPEVYLIASKENKGFARANNDAIAKALSLGAESVFLLNQDARVAADTVGKLYNAMAQNPEYGIISPLHLNGDGSKLDYGFEKYLKSNSCSVSKPVERIWKDSVSVDDEMTSESPFRIEFVNAAAWLVSRACLRDVGGFCPLFFMYGEDLEFAKRAKLAGYQMGVLPGAVICHARKQKDLKRELYSEKQELDLFKRSIITLYLDQDIHPLKRLNHLGFLLFQGFRRIILHKQISFFTFYGEKIKLLRQLKKDIRTLEPAGKPYRFIPWEKG